MFTTAIKYRLFPDLASFLQDFSKKSAQLGLVFLCISIQRGGSRVWPCGVYLFVAGPCPRPLLPPPLFMYRTVYICVGHPPVSPGQNVSPEPCQNISPRPPSSRLDLSPSLLNLTSLLAGAPAEPEESEGSGSGYSGPPASHTKPWPGPVRSWQPRYTPQWGPRPRPWFRPSGRQWRGPMGHVVPSFPQPSGLAWQPPPVIQQVTLSLSHYVGNMRGNVGNMWGTSFSFCTLYIIHYLKQI